MISLVASYRDGGETRVISKNGHRDGRRHRGTEGRGQVQCDGFGGICGQESDWEIEEKEENDIESVGVYQGDGPESKGLYGELSLGND